MSQPKTPRVDWAEPFPHLPGAPIVEAVIHWQVQATTELEPKALKAKVEAKVPGYRQVGDIRKFAFLVKVEEGMPTQAHESDWQGLRFASEDALYVVQIMRDGLVVSRLKPYQDWGQFSGEALRMWKAFRELASPAKVTRLGVRFINRIDLSGASDLGSMLQNPPKRLESWGLPISSFLYQSTHDVPDHPYQIKVIDTIQAAESAPALIVDIDASTTREFDAGDGKLLAEHLSRLHLLKNKAFFSLITKESIERFKQDPA